jgi:iron complex outermembrane receptor protein
VIVGLAVPAVADSARFHIEPQPLPAALRAFAQQADMQLLYEYTAVRGREGNSVIGVMEKHKALEQLLRNTGLKAVFSSAAAATLKPIRIARAAPTAVPQAPKPQVHAKAKGADPPQAHSVSGSSKESSNAAATPKSAAALSAALHRITINGYRVFTSQVLSAKQLVNSSQPAESITRSMINLFGPEAGGIQALSALPNVYISGYNNYSETGRSQISIRGIKIGWNSIPGDLATNAVTAELDGVPLNGLGQGTSWHSPEVPIGTLMSGENVIIGPGNPSERWYDSLGGTVDFIPVQPSALPGARVELAGGSDQTTDLSAVYNTGALDGWSTVVGLASARSDSFRSSSYPLPSDTEEAYTKTRKLFGDGSSVSFGAYYQRNHEWRPNMIPVSPVPLVDTGGLGIGTPYSEQTSGFYATLPRSVWNKQIEIQNWILWSHLRLRLSRNLRLSNMAWVRIGTDYHYRTNAYDLPSNPNYAGFSSNVQWYIQRSKNFGDRLALNERFNRMDTLSFGGYMIMALSRDGYTGSSTFDGSTRAIPEALFRRDLFSYYWAAFVQDNFRPLPRLKIVPGFRVVDFLSQFSNLSQAVACADYAGITGGNCPVSGTSYTVNGKTFVFQSYDTNPDQQTDYVRYEPSIGVNYEVISDLHLFGTFSITYHDPNSDNLDTFPVSLSSLKPPRSEEYDVGARYAVLRLGDMREVYASLDFFHMFMSDETLTYSTPQQPLVTFFGYGSGVYKGVDLSLQAHFRRHWSGFGNLGYLNTRWNEFSSPVTPSGRAFTGYGLPVSNSPKITFSGGISYLFRLPIARVHATLWDQYLGARYLFNHSIGIPSTVENPGYNLVNFSIVAHTRLIPGAHDSIISVQALNIMNKEYNSTEYISSGGYFQTPTAGYIVANPGAPRLIFASLTMKF